MDITCSPSYTALRALIVVMVQKVDVTACFPYFEEVSITVCKSAASHESCLVFGTHWKRASLLITDIKLLPSVHALKWEHSAVTECNLGELTCWPAPGPIPLCKQDYIHLWLNGQTVKYHRQCSRMAIDARVVRNASAVAASKAMKEIYAILPCADVACRALCVAMGTNEEEFLFERPKPFQMSGRDTIQHCKWRVAVAMWRSLTCGTRVRESQLAAAGTLLH